jgi:hypothetical protein
MEEKYKKRIMPENIFFVRCKDDKDEWFDISLNGSGYPSIDDAKKMKEAIVWFVEQLEELGENRINKINKEIIDEQNKDVRNIERPSKNKIKKKGYIYILKSNGLIKIGRTLTPKDRINTYKTQNPFDVELVFQKKVDDYLGVERMLIERYKNKRVKGKEWLILTTKDIQWIKNNI